jgi:hypothetical protein
MSFIEDNSEELCGEELTDVLVKTFRPFNFVFLVHAGDPLEGLLRRIRPGYFVIARDPGDETSVLALFFSAMSGICWSSYKIFTSFRTSLGIDCDDL